MPEFDDKCIFCRIVHLPDHWGHELILENDEFIAFLDRFPNTCGAVVIIPKAHYDSKVLHLHRPILHGLMDATAAVGDLLERAFPDIDRMAFASDGYGVNHAHIKGYPPHGTRNVETGETIIIKSQIKTYYVKYPGYLATNASNIEGGWELHDLAERIRAAAAELS